MHTHVNNILSSGYFESLLKTKPIDIKLSDWRNIAYHHSYTIKTNCITCSYGKPVKQFDVTSNDFLTYCHQIIRSGNVFSIARCIFAFDNIHELVSIKGKNNCGILFRKPLLIEQLKISLMSQGFLLDSFVENEKEVVVTLLDLTNNGSIILGELQKRQIHASQLLYKIWCVFKKSLVTVIYCSRDRRKIMCLSVDENICNDINSGKPISDMAKHVKFSKLI